MWKKNSTGVGFPPFKLMSESIPTVYIHLPRALDQSYCPGWGGLTRAGHLTRRPTDVRWQFNSIISYFRIFCMDKCKFCKQKSLINLDNRNILRSESIKMTGNSKNLPGWPEFDSFQKNSGIAPKNVGSWNSLRNYMKTWIKPQEGHSLHNSFITSAQPSWNHNLSTRNHIFCFINTFFWYINGCKWEPIVFQTSCVTGSHFIDSEYEVRLPDSS